MEGSTSGRSTAFHDENKTFIMSAIFMAFSVAPVFAGECIVRYGRSDGSCSCSNSGASCAGYVAKFVCDGRVTGECKSNEVYPGQQAQVQMG